MYRELLEVKPNLTIKKSPPFNGKASHKLQRLKTGNTQRFKSGLDGTRTRDPMRDRHVF